jgi:hypothetical protein
LILLVPKRINNIQTRYLKKKEYGQTPDYLLKRITEIKQAELQMANELAEKEKLKESKTLQEHGIVVLPDHERLRILKGLQDNWEKLNQDYQGLSLTVDTVPKIARYCFSKVEK